MRSPAMNRQHHPGFSQRMTEATRRLFRPKTSTGFLASPRIDAHTARDIGINTLGLV